MNTMTSIVRIGDSRYDFERATDARAFAAEWNRDKSPSHPERAVLVRDGEAEVAEILWELDHPRDDYPEEDHDY